MTEFWQKTFREAKDKRKGYKPRAVTGLGEEAFWVGDNKTGTLYVMKKNSYLRINIGGPGDETVKEEKLKALAQNALRRL